MNSQTHATSERFGYGGGAGGVPAPVTVPVAYHLKGMKDALGAINSVRQGNNGMSPANIRRFCRFVAPLVYGICTWPSKHFAWARSFPYPVSQNPTLSRLVPDPYDRFAAPIENAIRSKARDGSPNYRAATCVPARSCAAG